MGSLDSRLLKQLILLESHEEKLNKLNNTIEDIAKYRQDQAEITNKLQEELNKETEIVDKLKEKYSAAEAERIAVENEVRTLSDKLKEQHDVTEKAIIEKRDAITDVARLQRKLELLVDNRKEVSGIFDSFNKRKDIIKNLEATIERDAALRDVLQVKLKMAQERLSERTKELVEIDKQIKEVVARRTEFIKSIDTVRETAQKQKETMTREIKVAQKEELASRERSAKAKKENETLTETLKTLISRMESMEEEVKSYQSMIDEIKTSA